MTEIFQFMMDHPNLPMYGCLIIAVLALFTEAGFRLLKRRGRGLS
jgi:hypothetical protein